MDNSICKKVTSMLLLYIENKLTDEERFFVENHFKICSDCYLKYLEMKEVVKNLHFEYEKLQNEFEKIETNQAFSIREYEAFYKNISPYLDDELSYDDSIKFRKYLLKSKPARNELAMAYNLKNNIRHSAAMLKDNLNINFSKKIIKQLKEENRYSFDAVYKRAAALIGIMVSALIAISLFMGFSYFNHSAVRANAAVIPDLFDFPNDSELVEFTFDYGHDALIVNK